MFLSVCLCVCVCLRVRVWVVYLKTKIIIKKKKNVFKCLKIYDEENMYLNSSL